MSSDECHFNVSCNLRDKVTRPCPQTTTFEEKGEPKRIRTEVLPLTSLTPYRWAKPAHISIFHGSPDINVTADGVKRCLSTAHRTGGEVGVGES